MTIFAFYLADRRQDI